jgi:hypothetical protein
MRESFNCKINHSCVSENKLTKETEFLKYDINYPKIILYPKFIYHNDYDKYIIKRINKKIYKDTIIFKTSIEKQAYEYEQNYNKEDFKYQYEGYMDFKVNYDKNDIISITTEKYIFTGGAHGMTYLVSYNYNLKTGDEIKLKDLFKKSIDYKDIINNFIKESIKKNEDLYFKGDEGFKGISDNQKFYIINDGIVVYFDLYEIAPYYVSIPKFKLPFIEFKKYLNQKYICI